MPNVLGLDLGHHTVRAVLLAPPNAADRTAGARARLVGHAETSRLDSEGQPKPLAAVVAEIQSALTTRRAAVIAQAAEVPALVRFVATIPLAKDRLDRLLRLELSNHAEDGDLAADAQLVQAAGAGSDEAIHGCIIAQPATTRAVLADLATAGVHPMALSAAVGAVGNASLPSGPVRGDDIALLIDIGAAITCVTLVAENAVLAMRSLPMGGEAFTAALAETGLSMAEAEQRKCAGYGLVSAFAASAASAAPSTAHKPALAFDDDDDDDDGGIPFPANATTVSADPITLDLAGELVGEPVREPAKIPADVEPLPGLVIDAPVPEPGRATMALGVQVLGPELTRVAEALYTQLVATQRWFQSQLKRDTLVISKVLLTGGGAGLAGLDVYLSRRFALSVERANFFRHPDGGQAIAGEIPHTPHAWATALGLALAHPRLRIQGALAWDLRPEQALLRDARRRQVWPLVAAAGFVLVAGISTGLAFRASDQAQLATAARLDAWAKERDKGLADLVKLEAERDAQGEDLRAIAGRIYAGRDLLYAIRALKERAGQESKEVWVTNFATVGLQPVLGNDAKARATKPTVQDSIIDRGAILVSGRVKFESAPTDTERDRHRKDYQSKMETWRPGPGPARRRT